MVIVGLKKKKKTAWDITREQEKPEGSKNKVSLKSMILTSFILHRRKLMSNAESFFWLRKVIFGGHISGDLWFYKTMRLMLVINKLWC